MPTIAVDAAGQEVVQSCPKRTGQHGVVVPCCRQIDFVVADLFKTACRGVRHLSQKARGLIGGTMG